jgi:hypothetical protein
MLAFNLGYGSAGVLHSRDAIELGYCIQKLGRSYVLSD